MFQRISFNAKVLAVLTIVLLVVTVSGVLVNKNLREIITEITEEARPDQTIIVMKGMLFELAEAENGVKSYGLTKQVSYLDKFNRSTSLVNTQIEQLKELTKNDPDRSSKITELDSLTRNKFRVLEDLLIVQSQYSVDEVFAQVLKKVDQVQENENQVLSADESEETKDKFFKKLFNKRDKEEDTNQEKESNTTDQTSNLDSEFKKLKVKEKEKEETLKAQELLLIHEDKEIMGQITAIFYAMEADENSKMDARIESANQKSSNTIRYTAIFSILTFILLALAGYTIYSYVKRNDLFKKALKKAKDETDLKNEEITASINYAKRIQSAILPDLKAYNKVLPESFILYQPKDIVAGDFYWLIQEGNKVFIAVADCTGHGVPGALVSVVCHNALNRSVREFGYKRPAEILECARNLIIETFEEREEVVYDGMDIAICSIDLTSLTIEYSGANNSLYWVPKNFATAFTNNNANLQGTPYTIHHGKSNSKLVEIKADKQPVARYFRIKPFTNHKIKLEKGDTIYMFTDGYADQFGGEKSKKYTYQRFRENLLKHSDRDMELQKMELIKTLNNWMDAMEQVDDVCVIGVRL